MVSSSEECFDPGKSYQFLLKKRTEFLWFHDYLFHFNFKTAYEIRYHTKKDYAISLTTHSTNLKQNFAKKNLKYDERSSRMKNLKQNWTIPYAKKNF